MTIARSPSRSAPGVPQVDAVKELVERARPAMGQFAFSDQQRVDEAVTAPGLVESTSRNTPGNRPR